jgi:hypothetical protein
VRIFSKLHEVLGGAVASGRQLSDSGAHIITQAAMKLVYLLAMQVATVGDAQLETPATTAGSDPLAPPALVRVLSGPATLSDSVFQMLYAELKTLLEGMLKRRAEAARSRPSSVRNSATSAGVPAADADTTATTTTAAAATVAAEDTAATSSSDAAAASTDTASTTGVIAATDAAQATVGSADSSSGATTTQQTDSVSSNAQSSAANDAAVLQKVEAARAQAAAMQLTSEQQLLLSETTMLLLCVSSSPACARQLSRPHWIALLLRLLQLAPAYAQRRALKLQRQLLPSCAPAELAGYSRGRSWSIAAVLADTAVSADGAQDGDGGAFDADSSSELDGDTAAKQLLRFLLNTASAGFVVESGLTGSQTAGTGAAPAYSLAQVCTNL